MSTLVVDWIYRLDSDVCYESKMRFPGNYLFRDKKNKIRMAITRTGEIYVTKNYSWDGCTPKICLFDLYFGTPDGAIHKETQKPKTYQASLVHDALYQFYAKGRPYSLKDSDKIFQEILKKYDFALQYVYYLGVRVFGKPVQKIVNWKRKNDGEMEGVADNHPDLIAILNQPNEPV